MFCRAVLPKINAIYYYHENTAEQNLNIDLELL